MKTILCLLGFILFGSSLFAGDVRFTLRDFAVTTQPLIRRTVEIQPNSTPVAEGTNIVISERRYFNSGTNAEFTVTNMVAGDYRCLLYGPTYTNVFWISVPTFSGTTNAASLLIANGANAQRVVTTIKTNGTAISTSARSLNLIAGTNVVLRGTNASGFVDIEVNAASGGAGGAATNAVSTLYTNAGTLLSGATGLRFVQGSNTLVLSTNEGGGIASIQINANQDSSASNKVQLTTPSTSGLTLSQSGSGGIQTWTINHFPSNAVFIHSSQSNSLVSMVAAAGQNALIVLGPGTFTLGNTTELPMTNGQTIAGSGVGTTIINGSGDAEAVIRMDRNCVLRDLTIDVASQGGVVPIQHVNSGTTNCLIERVHTRSLTDAIIWNITNSVVAFTAKNSFFESSWDVFHLTGTNATRFKFIDCAIYGDPLIDPSFAVNVERVINPFLNFGGIVEATRLHISISNALSGTLTLNSASPPLASRYVLSDVTFDVAVTNGGTFSGWNYGLYSSYSTNAFASYNNVQPLLISTNALYWTNPPGPSVVSMTSTSTRTNFLPNIGFNGLARYNGLIVTVKDGAGNAAANNVTVRPTGGATIDGETSYTINRNGGAASFLVGGSGGTNWQLVSSGLTSTNLAGISAVYGAFGDVKVTNTITADTFSGGSVSVSGAISGLELTTTGDVGVGGAISLGLATASRPAYIDANALLTNASGTANGQNVMLDTGVLTAISNKVVVAAGTGGITVTPSGSGGVMTFTVSDDDAGGGGGGASTNANQFGAAGATLTLKDGVALTNAISRTSFRVSGSQTNTGGGDIVIEDGSTTTLWLFGSASGPGLFTLDENISFGFPNRSLVVSSNENRIEWGQQPYGNLGFSSSYGWNQIFGSNITLAVPTRSRVAMIDAQGTITNVTSAAPSTDYVKADGTVGVPAGGIGATNANQFGESTTLTIKSGALLTNTVLRGSTTVSNLQTPPVILSYSTTNVFVDGSLGNVFYLNMSNHALIIHTNFSAGQFVFLETIQTNGGTWNWFFPTQTWSFNVAPYLPADTNLGRMNILSGNASASGTRIYGSQSTGFR